MAERMPASLFGEWIAFRTFEYSAGKPEPTRWDPPEVKREKLQRQADLKAKRGGGR